MYGLTDAALTVTKALPTDAASVVTDGIDLGGGPEAHSPGNCELLINAPAVTTAMLGDNETLKYDVEDSADGSNYAPIAKEVVVQTGAGGAGAEATSGRYRLPTNVRRYVHVKVTKSASGDASGVSVTAALVF